MNIGFIGVGRMARTWRAAEGRGFHVTAVYDTQPRCPPQNCVGAWVRRRSGFVVIALSSVTTVKSCRRGRDFDKSERRRTQAPTRVLWRQRGWCRKPP